MKRLALDFVVALGSDVILRVDQHAKLSHVEFRDQNSTVSMQHFAEVFREWIEPSQVSVSD
jgi:hypothetical protein